MTSVAQLYQNHVGPAAIVALYLCPPHRETVTTGKGPIVPIDKLKLLLLSVGLLSMASLF